MEKSNYENVHRIEIYAKKFEYDLACMGWQLVSILTAFVNEKNIKWLVFDLYGSTESDLNFLFKKNDKGFTVFDSTHELISSVEKVIQTRCAFRGIPFSVD